MKELLITALFSIFLSACSSAPSHSAFNDSGYTAWLSNIGEKIKRNPNYQRIPINSEEQQKHFSTLSYKAYKKEISKQEFIKKMNDKYSGYLKSIKWIANQLPR